MSIYKRGFIITTVISIISLVIAIGLNYVLEENFWCNVCLGVFGSSILSTITSFVGYFVERKNVTVGFYIETVKVVQEINKYQSDLSLDDKIDFFLSLSEYDTTALDMYYGQMDFFQNRYRKNVYERIYHPVLTVLKKASSYAWHFRMHKNGTGRNEVVMQKFVDEIETVIFEKIQHRCEVDENQEYVVTEMKNKIIEDILDELNGWYYEMMYGRKKARKVMEEEFNG